MSNDFVKYELLLRVIYTVYVFVGAAVFMAIVLIDGGKDPQLLLKGMVGCAVVVIVSCVVTRKMVMKKVQEQITSTKE